MQLTVLGSSNSQQAKERDRQLVSEHSKPITMIS